MVPHLYVKFLVQKCPELSSVTMKMILSQCCTLPDGQAAGSTAGGVEKFVTCTGNGVLVTATSVGGFAACTVEVNRFELTAITPVSITAAAIAPIIAGLFMALNRAP